MGILNYSVEEFIEKAGSFHGHLAPGMICGGFMVDLAYKYLPENGFYDAICETRACIPDSVQILTPCTIGNGWLKIIDTGRFALAFYNKSTGQGVRVYLDQQRLETWPEFKIWAMKLKPKKEQDKERLIKEIIDAGSSVYAVKNIIVDIEKIHSMAKKKISMCASCGESFRNDQTNSKTGIDGFQLCPGCSGDLPFSTVKFDSQAKSVNVENAMGLKLAHDMTKIEPGISKEVAFKKGHEVSPDDVEKLKSMGKSRIFTHSSYDVQGKIHENDAAIAFAEAMSGKNIIFDPEPKEGRIDLKAECDGVLVIDTEKLISFNRIDGVMCASMPMLKTVIKGQTIAGTRAIPLYLENDIFNSAISSIGRGGIFSVRKFRNARAGIVITGSEIASGKIKDRFAPVISKSLKIHGCEITGKIICKDVRKEITDAVMGLMDKGADLIIVTGGLSVDPDDVTRFALEDAGMSDILYGAPILPGAMTLIGKIRNSDVLGVPAGALYSKPAALDILLPLILAGVRITRADLAKMAVGGLLETSKRNESDFDE